MKVLFVVTGIGYGDATREHANIEALLKRYPEAEVLVACYDNSFEYFKYKYPVIKIFGYRMKGREHKFKASKFATSNYLLPFFWMFGTAHMQFQVNEFYPDLIITDFEPTGIVLGKFVGKKVVAIFGFDPELYREYKAAYKINTKMKIEAEYLIRNYQQANFVIIPSFIKNKKSLEYHYVNPIMRKVPKLDPEKVIMKRLKLKKKPILVMLGGSNYGEKLALTINKIAKQFDEDFIVFGGDFKISRKNVTYIPFAENVFEYLKVCKGVITLGGMISLTEALVMQKPILCYPIIDHIEQQLNAYALRNVIQVEHDHSTKKVRKALIKFLKDLPKLNKKVKKYNLKADGSEEVVNVIEGLVG